MPLLLLVEGSNDLHLIKNVAREHSIEIDANEFRDCGGIENLLHETLPIWLKSSVPSVGVVIDADLDVAARWSAVTHQLKAAGYEVPQHPVTEGLVLTDRRPAVGVWLMPNNSVPGTLEDFVAHLVPDSDSLWPRAVNAVGSIPAAERRFKAIRKAEVHTYLAWQEDPGTPMGLAVTKKYFQTDAELCHTFVEWLRRLRDIP